MQRENGKGRKSSPMVERAEREERPPHMCQVSKCSTRGKKTTLISHKNPQQNAKTFSSFSPFPSLFIECNYFQ